MKNTVSRIGVMVVQIIALCLWTHSASSQGSPSVLERLGPIPKDQQELERERSLKLPLVQQDAYQFARSGERRLKLEPRIVGGSPAPISAYPWQISLSLSGIPASVGHFCGGSVIADQWVVTAAHCVDGATKPESLKVLYGTNFLSQGGRETNVSKIILHEKWDAASYDYDVAVLKTEDLIEAVPIKLVNSDNAASLVPVGVLGTVSGWGLLREGGTTTDVLQHVGVQVTSREICNSPTAYGGQITERMVCAGFATGGKDSCQGDSGGPLMVFDRVGGYALAGVVSWGEGCARPNKFGVYTRVSSVVDWILRAISE